MAERVVGIDLGTTHTVLASARLANPEYHETFEIPQLVSTREVAARALLPSCLYAPLAGEAPFDPWGDAPWVIGEYARRRGQELPGRFVSSPKSWLSHSGVDRMAQILPWSVSEAGSDVQRISPVEASFRILQHVRQAYDAAFPKQRLEHQQIVLTVPASFDQAARELTHQAARRAGLPVRLLEEPQAAFYDYMQRVGTSGLDELLEARDEALILVCDVGGGTTDLSLIRVARKSTNRLEVTRLAVGRHLLLGGDNMDLALAHLCEARLCPPPVRLEPGRFAELVLACRTAKERLLAAEAADAVPIRLLGSGSELVGRTLSTQLSREDVEHVVLEGFFPHVAQGEHPVRRRAGIVAFGLPYEPDPAITRHLASFFARHAADRMAPDAVLLNGGVFRAARLAERLYDVVCAWSEQPVLRLSQPHPDLAVATGAVVYGLALAGHGVCIGGGAAHGYYVGIDGVERRRAICVVPRGSREGERHVANVAALTLQLGRPVRFELFASDSAPVHAPGQIVELDDERFESLPPVATTFETHASSAEEVPVALEGELTAIGTLELGCCELHSSASQKPRHFRLAFELRGNEAELARAQDRASDKPRPPVRALAGRQGAAFEAVQRVFGKGRSDVSPRETKDLLRELERLLGERASWTGEVTRALFDVIAAKHRARRRSPDHERVYWMLTGYCLRPGFGHALDPQRIRLVAPLFAEGLVFSQEARGWQQFFIAWRRMVGGLPESIQTAMRDVIAPFMAADEVKRPLPKSFKPLALDEMLELASWLERLPRERRTELGGWILERTWTARDPRLWAAIGRIGARVPAYASAHHVIAPSAAERFLDHLLREKWQDVASAPRAAMLLARVTGDRARDVSEPVRLEVRRALERAGAREAWIRAVSEYVPVEEAERAENFGEELPVGLRLVE